jgi:hypothetical protein
MFHQPMIVKIEQNRFTSGRDGGQAAVSAAGENVQDGIARVGISFDQITIKRNGKRFPTEISDADIANEMALCVDLPCYPSSVHFSLLEYIKDLRHRAQAG